MDQLDDPRIEPGLIENLKRISDQKGVPVWALINMAIKDFILSMDDDLAMSAMPELARV